MKTKLIVIFVLVTFAFSLCSERILARDENLQTNYTVYLPIINKPWVPELFVDSDGGGNPEKCGAINHVSLFWTILFQNGNPYYDGYRVEESLNNQEWIQIYEGSNNAAVFVNASPWGIHYYRVYGYKTGESSGFSNILPLEIFWRYGYNDLQIWGDENGGAVNVSLPVRENYARIYFGAVPGATINPPPGSIYYNEWFWYMDFPPGTNASFSTTWTKQDCSGYLSCMYFSALSSPWERLDEVAPPPYCMGRNLWP